MAITKLNSLAIPDDTIVEADLSYPLTNFSSTGIDDNATSTAITIDSSQNVSVTGDITSGGDSVITTQSPELGRRNLIINGDMQVWQRGTSSTATSLDYHTVDRFWNYLPYGGTAQRSTDVPSGEGFVYSYRLTSSDFWAMGQPIELPAAGKTILRDNTDYTLSFWAKASASETITVAVRYRNGKGNGTNSTPIKDYFPTIGTSWTRYSVTFNTGTITPASTNQIIDVEIADGAALDIYFTGLQFEQSSVATPFEHRSFGEELALCQRYYEVVDGQLWLMRVRSSDDLRKVSAQYAVTKRADPTITITDQVLDGATSLDVLVNGVSCVSFGGTGIATSAAPRINEFTIDAEL